MDYQHGNRYGYPYSNLYLVHDYETFKEHVLRNDSKIETVVVIGKNKYKEEILTKLKRDIREELIPSAIIIGNEPIEDTSEQFLKWNWTFPEFAKLSEMPVSEIHSIDVGNSSFITAISNYLNDIKALECEHAINLSPLFRFRKYLYSSIEPINQNSRLRNYVEYVKQLMTKETAALIGDALYCQNKNPQQHQEKSTGLINEIFNKYSNIKLNALCLKKDFDVLVVPDFHVKIWKDEFKVHGKILSFNEFIEEQSSTKATIKAIFLSLFGYNKNNKAYYSPNELVDFIHKTSHQYYFLCYPDEAALLKALLNIDFNNLLSEYKSEQRKALTGIEFHIKPKVVEVSELIEEFNLRSEKETKANEHEIEQIQINYLLSFAEPPEIVCDGSKYVLLETASGKYKERISNLRTGDWIRVYSNVSKEKLFDIAVSEDKEGRLKTIDGDSKIWKAALSKYFKDKFIANPFFMENDLLNELKIKGSTITNISTIKKWMKIDDKEKFPSTLQNLVSIKELIQNSELNTSFESIKRSRRLFRSIMIALGRDLSDEVMDYVVTCEKSKGKILSRFSAEEIKLFISQSAPLRKIKTIEITEADETI